MKALPRRKGNGSHLFLGDHAETLNESLSQKEGKFERGEKLKKRGGRPQ